MTEESQKTLPDQRLSQLADDMRASLGVVVAYAALLRNQKAGPLNATQTKYIQSISIAAKQLWRHLKTAEGDSDELFQ